MARILGIENRHANENPFRVCRGFCGAPEIRAKGIVKPYSQLPNLSSMQATLAMLNQLAIDEAELSSHRI